MNLTAGARPDAARTDAPALDARADTSNPGTEHEARLDIDSRGTVVGGSPAGLKLLHAGVPMRLHETHLVPADDTRHDAWWHALQAAFLRRAPMLFVLARPGGGEVIAIVPDLLADRATVRFQRLTPCAPASLAAYGGAIGLTEAEARVMRLLAQGLSPRQIADHGGTAESTVRSQVRSILAKSGHAGIRPLLLQLARLPSLD